MITLLLNLIRRQNPSAGQVADLSVRIRPLSQLDDHSAPRPPVNAELSALVKKMAAANPLWGAPRIHGELLKLGIDLAERTVSRLIPKRRTPPSQTWRTFLTNHVQDLVSIDFFTVPTAHLRVLFVLVVLANHRRRVLHFNITEHPSSAWTAQQIVDAFPDDTAPAYLLRDRDAIYGGSFRQRVQGMQIQEVLTAARSPWQKGYAPHCTSGGRFDTRGGRGRRRSASLRPCILTGRGSPGCS
jgi:putative transposase